MGLTVIVTLTLALTVIVTLTLALTVDRDAHRDADGLHGLYRARGASHLDLLTVSVSRRLDSAVVKR